MQTARLILDPPATGAWNMAADEALLLTAASSGATTLRIYAWSQPTLSLGYFQSYQERSVHEPSRACPVVRRATGGGAIIHDDELTYSLTVAVRDRAARELEDWYGLCHAAWISTLGSLGIAAKVCPATAADLEHRFLCFERRAAGDLLLGGAKIGGSAQRRHRHAMLQHGSLLLGRSPAAPELPGINDLAVQPLTGTRWRDAWVEDLAQRLSVRWQLGGYSEAELERIEQLQSGKFQAAKWTLRR